MHRMEWKSCTNTKKGRDTRSRLEQEGPKNPIKNAFQLESSSLN